MFVEAIEEVKNFTRPIHTIARNYGSETPFGGAATLFFVNEEGVAITCRHVLDQFLMVPKIIENYTNFKNDLKSIAGSKKYSKDLKSLEDKYKFEKNVTPIEMINIPIGCVEGGGCEYIRHETLDLAIMKFKNFSKSHYKSHAVFLKDDDGGKQGKTLCRLGYPFAEFNNFEYSKSEDKIRFTNSGKIASPIFPIDGMVTRGLLDVSGEKIGLEMSTPGLRGQSGGPLFDKEGTIYGMQSMTAHLYLGFDIKANVAIGGQTKTATNTPFLHVGHCVHASQIKKFLNKNGIKFYER